MLLPANWRSLQKAKRRVEVTQKFSPSQYENKNQYCTASQFMRRLVTCLAICEDAGVVSQEGVVQQTLSETLEHDVLA